MKEVPETLKHVLLEASDNFRSQELQLSFANLIPLEFSNGWLKIIEEIYNLYWKTIK